MARQSGSEELAVRYEQARVRYEKLLARAQWWERWRGLMLMPLMLAGAGAGAGVAVGIRQLVALPSQAEAYAAVFGVVAVGRWASVHFNTRKLEVARRVVRGLERELREGGAGGAGGAP